MSLVEPVSLMVAQLLQVKHAASVAKAFSESLGFSQSESDEIALVITELGSNLVRHASGGLLRLTAIEQAERIGIRIESEDSGPGIFDVERALTDGFSTAGSLGTGLGTVNRLMDDLEIRARTPSGVYLVAHRWVRPVRKSTYVDQLQFGVATRPYRYIPENGDTFVVKQWDGFALAGVIDGLGHGVFAQKAAQIARQYLEQHFDQPLDSLFRGVQRACRATRGVVMALARFDVANKKITVASIGNVEVRLFGSDEHFSLIVRRGVVGLNAPNPVLVEHPWDSSCVLILHSDGLRTHWHWSEFPELAMETPDVIARKLLHALGKLEDDATVLVARSGSTLRKPNNSGGASS